jgi:hypothetical protein
MISLHEYQEDGGASIRRLAALSLFSLSMKLAVISLLPQGGGVDADEQPVGVTGCCGRSLLTKSKREI